MRITRCILRHAEFLAPPAHKRTCVRSVWHFPKPIPAGESKPRMFSCWRFAAIFSENPYIRYPLGVRETESERAAGGSLLNLTSFSQASFPGARVLPLQQVTSRGKQRDGEDRGSQQKKNNTEKPFPLLRNTATACLVCVCVAGIWGFPTIFSCTRLAWWRKSFVCPGKKGGNKYTFNGNLKGKNPCVCAGSGKDEKSPNKGEKHNLYSLSLVG